MAGTAGGAHRDERATKRARLPHRDRRGGRGALQSMQSVARSRSQGGAATVCRLRVVVKQDSVKFKLHCVRERNLWKVVGVRRQATYGRTLMDRISPRNLDLVAAAGVGTLTPGSTEV